jgi:23S rRNA (uracil1939-C5)-methyltransferase
MARRGRRSAPRPAPSEIYDLEIRAIGDQGDGIASLPDGRTVFVDGALPGETVRAEIFFRDRQPPRGAVAEILVPAPLRRTPPCPVAGACGGCMVQHLELDAYRSWKRSQVTERLAAAGLDPSVTAELAETGERTRRRAVWQYRFGEGRLLFGYAVRRGDRIVDVDDCLLLAPALGDVLTGLRRELPGLFAGPVVRRGRVLATALDAGADVLIEFDREPDLRQLEGMSAIAERLDLARLAWRIGNRGEPTPAAMRRLPAIGFGPFMPAVPAGAFLQASEAGERLIREEVIAALDNIEGPVADLFAGLGSLTGPVAERHPVHAVEGMAAMADALSAAVRSRPGPFPVTVETRDLERRPLTASELDRYRALVIDPPRAGASRQVGEAAETASLERIVYVSCSPESFARDAARLTGSGWRLAGLRPIDQFVYSDQVELVARFDRAG